MSLKSTILALATESWWAAICSAFERDSGIAGVAKAEPHAIAAQSKARMVDFKDMTEAPVT